MYRQIYRKYTSAHSIKIQKEKRKGNSPDKTAFHEARPAREKYQGGDSLIPALIAVESQSACASDDPLQLHWPVPCALSLSLSLRRRRGQKKGRARRAGRKNKGEKTKERERERGRKSIRCYCAAAAARRVKKLARTDDETTLVRFRLASLSLSLFLSFSRPRGSSAAAVNRLKVVAERFSRRAHFFPGLRERERERERRTRKFFPM